MKYKFTNMVQDYSYSCIDELRVDLMKTMQYLEDKSKRDAWVHIILSKDNARRMYDLLTDSEYKGVTFHAVPDFYDNDEELNADEVAITINSDSEIIVEKLNTTLTCCFKFLVIDKSIPEFERITERYTEDEDNSDYILRFTIE